MAAMSERGEVTRERKLVAKLIDKVVNLDYIISEGTKKGYVQVKASDLAKLFKRTEKIEKASR